MKKNSLFLFLVILAICSACSVIHEVDSAVHNINEHIEGWITLITIVGMLYGGIKYLNNNTELLRDNSTEKKPLVSLFKGLSLFRQFNWQQVFKAADRIAIKLNSDGYSPTLIVCVGRGGAIFGSLLSYNLGELPILALDRIYIHKTNGDREESPMYPFRIPSAYLKRVLLVAGESHTRKTLVVFNERLKAIGAKEIRNCVFYNQIMPASKSSANVDIHYWGKRRRHDYLMPWQNSHSLHPSENKADADAQNRRVGAYIEENDNCFNQEGFYCMRHAMTKDNKEDRFIGRASDPPLSDDGVKQAKKVGLYFKRIGVSFDIIYSSTSTRCVNTAIEISRTVGGRIETRDELLEFDYGEWEGLTRGECHRRQD